MNLRVQSESLQRYLHCIIFCGRFLRSLLIKTCIAFITLWFILLRGFACRILRYEFGVHISSYAKVHQHLVRRCNLMQKLCETLSEHHIRIVTSSAAPREISPPSCRSLCPSHFLIWRRRIKAQY